MNGVIRNDVREFNAAMGQEIARAALPQFSDDNCVYAPSTFLWELDDHLEPSDPLKNHRLNICRDNPLLYFACYRASLAHPNPNGAAHYAEKIISEIKNWPGFSLT